MKNIIFFVVLAILTVAGLVGWNAVRQNSTTEFQEQVTQVPEATPTSSIGTVVGRETQAGLGQSATASGFTQVTKGGTDSNSPVIPTTTVALQALGVSTQSADIVTASQQIGTVITLSDSGFVPKTISLKLGTMVKFINQSSRRMWIVSQEVSGGKKLDSMDMGRSVGKDGSYEFQFVSQGTWGFINKEQQNVIGSVVVN